MQPPDQVVADLPADDIFQPVPRDRLVTGYGGQGSIPEPLVFPWSEIGDRQVGNPRPGDEDGLCQQRLSIHGQPETRHLVQVAWHEGHEHGVRIRMRIHMRAHPPGVQDLLRDDELHPRVAAPNRFSVETGRCSSISKPRCKAVR